MIGTPTLMAVALIGAAMILESDLGRHRMTWFRLLRAPVVSIGLVLPLAPAPTWSGAGLAAEAAGVVIGIAAGFAAVQLVAVRAADGCAWQRAGAAYAAAVLAFALARCLFTYGAEHWYPDWLGSVLERYEIDGDAFAVTLVYVSLAFTVTRTVFLAHAGRVAVRSTTEVTSGRGRR